MNQDPQAGIQSQYEASMRTIHELGSAFSHGMIDASMRTIQELGSTGWYLVMV